MELSGDFCASGKDKYLLSLRDLMSWIVDKNPGVINFYDIELGHYPIFIGEG